MSDKIKLLVVDDELRFLDSVSARLELRGFEMTRASSGQEALERASQGTFDLALLDLKMPGVDGIQVLRTLKEQGDRIEVIVMTGHGSSAAAVECMELGAFGYLPKPYELEETMEILRQAYATRLKEEHQADEEFLAKLKGLQNDPDVVASLRAMRDLVD